MSIESLIGRTPRLFTFKSALAIAVSWSKHSCSHAVAVSNVLVEYRTSDKLWIPCFVRLSSSFFHVQSFPSPRRILDGFVGRSTFEGEAFVIFGHSFGAWLAYEMVQDAANVNKGYDGSGSSCL